MKKLLVLMLVLGMASMANAAYVLAWDGTTLSMKSDTGGYSSDDNFAIICTSAHVDIYTNAMTIPTSVYDASGDWGQASGVIGGILPSGMDGRFGFVGTFGFFPPQTGASWQNVTFATLTPSVTQATTAYLYKVTEEDGLVQLWDTKLIPEPMTIALLGLGGLFLRRRK